jgi:carbamoyltransferase
MYTLGINAAYHDSAACLVRDGCVLAAAEEERFTGTKHGKRPVPFSTWELPYHAIHYCLSEAGIRLPEVAHVAYAFDPWLLPAAQAIGERLALPVEPSAHPVPPGWEAAWDGLFLSSLVNAPRLLVDGAPHHLQSRFRGATATGPFRWHFVPHHLAHAASAFLASPFQEAAVLTLDGRGERATTAYFVGRGTDLSPVGEVHMPHSLGLLYERVTSHLGFLHSSDEYKVMALASYGEPRYLEEFRRAVRLEGDGRYRVDGPDLDRLGPPRERGAALERRHRDIARSLQAVTEELTLGLTRWLHARTGQACLCMAGGVALNCVMNARLRDEGPFARVWVQPAAGDAGTALGAALWVDARSRPSSPGPRPYRMTHAFLGPAYADAEIEAFLKQAKLRYRRLEQPPEQVAELLARDLVIGWFQGRMEFGPRALGARSILASPLDAAMQARLNEIKDREDFRPVAPVVLEEAASEWFAPAGEPFMLFVSRVRPEKAARIPAVRHVDGTARVQTIRREQHPAYYELVQAFAARTGVPVLINTSFNVRGRPIVCRPRDAVEAFWTSPLDALVLGPFLLEKTP